MCTCLHLYILSDSKSCLPIELQIDGVMDRWIITHVGLWKPWLFMQRAGLHLVEELFCCCAVNGL